MGKSSRSPLLGYNHNVKYRGHVFHVQTEDSGPANPHLFTHLFYEGSILATKKCDYDGATDEDQVRGLMQAQHKQILKDLKQAAFDDKLVSFFAGRGEVFGAAETGGDQPAPHPSPAQQPPESDASAETRAAIAPDETAASAPRSVLDLDAAPPSTPDQAPVPERLPLHHTRPIVPGPGTYTFRRPTREIGSAAVPNRPGVTPARPVVPVVVQRRVAVGGTHPTPNPNPVAPPPRVRRPASATPYVVREGSHPDLAAVRQGATPAPVQTDDSPAPRVAAPPPPPRPAAGTANQSLDDVILAYLSQGENKS